MSWTIPRVFMLVLAVCVILLAIEPFTHGTHYFAFQSYTGFYALLGFGSYFFYIIMLKFWRILVKRHPAYYDKQEDKS